MESNQKEQIKRQLLKDSENKEVKFVGEISEDEMEKLKAKYGRVDIMYIPANDDGTEWGVGYFKKIDRDLMGAALSITDPIKSKQTILEATFIAGDKRILEDREMFFSACMEADKMMTFRKGYLKKN